jgi:hypothetical protein
MFIVLLKYCETYFFLHIKNKPHHELKCCILILCHPWREFPQTSCKNPKIHLMFYKLKWQATSVESLECSCQGWGLPPDGNQEDVGPPPPPKWNLSNSRQIKNWSVLWCCSSFPMLATDLAAVKLNYPRSNFTFSTPSMRDHSLSHWASSVLPRLCLSKPLTNTPQMRSKWSHWAEEGWCVAQHHQGLVQAARRR